MTPGRTSLHAQLPMLAVLSALLPGSGCSVYDADLLQSASSGDPTLDEGHLPGPPDARPAGDAYTGFDAGRAFDAGHVVDSGAQRDAAVVPDSSVTDASLDASALSDAGCMTSTNPDGTDCCASDPNKTDPGGCGCEVADVDGDSDGALDCMDACPSDPAKVDPGPCGCGVPDTDGDGVASCLGIEGALVHRYRFDGTGTSVTDSVGSSHGTLVNAQLTDTGAVALAGGTSDQYVDLPNGIVSSLSNATFEAWLTWNGGAAWQRIFDFGDPTSGGEGAQASGRSYLFLTAASDATVPTVRAVYKRSTSNETLVNATAALASGTLSHVAVVVDDSNNQLALYVNGALAMSTALSDSLSSISDINNWIGRSQFSNDAELGATVQEFRIYNVALSAAQLATSFNAGPDPAFLQP